MKNLFATFSNYLVPNSSLRDDRCCSQLCSSCRCQHLKPLHERHIKMANLRARNTQTAAQFRTILQNVSTEPQKVQDNLSSGKAEKSLRSVWETTAGNDAHEPKQSVPIELKYLGFPYQKFPARRVYKCPTCKAVTVKSLAAIKAHIRHVHLGQAAESGAESSLKPYAEDNERDRITYCGKYFFVKLPNGSFKCGSCDFISKGRLTSILGHIRLKHASILPYRPFIEVSPNKFECNGLQAERMPDGSFLCGSCPFTAKSAVSLRQHLNSKHAEGRSKVCEVCGKVFKNERRLYSHRLTHPTGPEKKCDRCERSFPTKSTLWAHIVRVHKQYRSPCTSRTYVCEMCGKEYKTKGAYSTHMNNVHQSVSERKKFDCKVCYKSYASYMCLHVHMNSHTGKKVHSCDVCDMKFTQAYSVVRHKNVTHKKT